MRTWILKNIARLTYKYPRLFLFMAFLLTIVGIYGSFQVHIESNIINLLPEHSTEATTFRRALEDFGAFDYMMVLIETPEQHQEDLLIEVADTFAHTINDRTYIQSIDYKLDKGLIDFFMEYAEERFVFLLTESDWSAIQQRLDPESIKQQLTLLKQRLLAVGGIGSAKMIEDPLNFSGIIRQRLLYTYGPTELNLRRGYFISKRGSMLMMIVRPVTSSSDVLFCRKLMRFLQQARTNQMARLGDKASDVNIYFIGSHVEAYHDARIIRRDLYTTAIASFLLVMTLFALAFRHGRAIAYVGLPLCVSLIWTLGLIGFFFNRLTIVTFSFVAVLIGLSIDFAIHIYNRFIEELHKGRHVYPALRLAIIRTGKGIITGALTTAIVFYCLNFTSFKGFKELGTVAGNGIICGLLAIYMILPPLLVLTCRKGAGKLLEIPISNFYLTWITQRLMNYPRLVVIFAIILTAYMGYSALGITFNENVRKLRQPNPEYVTLKRKLERHFPLPGNQVIAIVSGKSIEETLRKNDRLYSNIEESKDTYPILSCDSLRTFLPSQLTQRTAQDLILSLNIEQIKLEITKQALTMGFEPRAFEPFFQQIERLQNFARESDIITLSSIKSPLLMRLVQRYMIHAGSYYRVVTHIYPLEGNWIYQVPREALKSMSEGAGHVEFTGVTILSSALERMAKVDLAIAVILATLSVILITMFHFGNINRTIMATIPIACGIIWMLGTMAIIGIEMNFLNIIVVPMIIGLGVDDGIHLVSRYYELRRYNIKNAIEYTGRAVVLTSLTSMLGFGSLALANYRGLKEMGLLAIMGLGYTLISSLLVLPAVLKIWGKHYRISEFFVIEEGEIH